MARRIKSGGRFGLNQPLRVIKTPARFTPQGVIRSLGSRNGVRVVTEADALQLAAAREAAGVTAVDKNFARQIKSAVGGAALSQVERQNVPVGDDFAGV